MTIAFTMIATATERLIPEIPELPGKRRTNLQKFQGILWNSIDFHRIEWNSRDSIAKTHEK